MNPMTGFLIAMQAAGLITSIYDTKQKQKTIQMGRQLEQEQFTTNLEAIRLESAESSLAEIKQLNKNLSSQIVTQAARGNRGPSSAMASLQSISNFQNDERTRRINLLAKESQLRANNILSGLHTNKSETQLGQALTQTIFESLPVSTLFDLGSKKTKQNNNEGGFSWGL